MVLPPLKRSSSLLSSSQSSCDSGGMCYILRLEKVSLMGGPGPSPVSAPVTPIIFTCFASLMSP